MKQKATTGQVAGLLDCLRHDVLTATSRFALVFAGFRSFPCSVSPLLRRHLFGGFLATSSTLLSKVFQCFRWKFRARGVSGLGRVAE